MKSSFYTLFSALAIMFSLSFSACGGADKGTDAKENKSTEVKTETTEVENATTVNLEEKKVDANRKVIDATFIEFSYGDFEHLIFRDETGKEWDFMGYSDKVMTEFPLILEDSYEGNPKFLNKKFKVGYTVEEFVNEYNGGSKDEAYLIESLELL